MAPVVMVFSTSLVAVAAFMRVDPVSTSGPTLGRISTSQVPVSSCGGMEQDTQPVTPPSGFAGGRAGPTHGGGPPSAYPQTTDRGAKHTRSLTAIAREVVSS